MVDKQVPETVKLAQSPQGGLAKNLVITLAVRQLRVQGAVFRERTTTRRARIFSCLRGMEGGDVVVEEASPYRIKEPRA